MSYDVVIPTAGRSSLAALLTALAAARGPRPRLVIVVDDRATPTPGLPLRGGGSLEVRVVESGGAGPAAARNAGWRQSAAEWVVCLDDDVLPAHDWPVRLEADLAGLDDRVAASQGRVVVPLPPQRRPTDRERVVAGLERARWATADMAYRRRALAALGGFDERFPRAYREDADLGLRLLDAGFTIAAGSRIVVHPVPPAGPWESLRRQAGNADDALMLARHGRGWRRRAGAPCGRRGRHLAITASGLLALAAGASGHRRQAAAVGVAWLLGTAELAAARILAGPLTPGEVTAMLLTSLAIPPLAAGHWLRGLAAHWRPRRRRPCAVLFDRDGTLVDDVPYNGDPEQVTPRPGAREALDRLRRRGLPIAVVSNQSGVARGVLDADQVERVNRRVAELVGPIATWAVCMHGPDDGCACRKPRPGLVLEAAARLGVAPERCAVVGDIGADVEAARAAGARGVLVPTPVTRAEEVAAASEVAPDLDAAVTRLLGERG
ncbi:MAG TPA: HAD-IIIA family hydrolase [Candidatus Eisenbacteria bacterium]|nr:HAD-IIIA family hydrolase [Candidatus Eisenbacteria bacterium]